MSGVFRLLRLIKGEYKRMGFVFALSLICASLNTAGPYLLATAIDRYRSDTLIQLILIYIAVNLANEGLSVIYGYCVENINNHIILSLRNKAFLWAFTKRRDAALPGTDGEIVTRVMSDVDAVTQVFASPLNGLLPDILSGIGGLVMLSRLNWYYPVIIALVLPLLYLATKWINNHSRAISQSVKVRTDSLTNLLLDLLQNHILAYFYSHDEGGTFSRNNDELFSEKKVLNRKFSAYWASTNLLRTFGTAALLLMGAASIAKGRLEIGALVLIVSYSRTAYAPVVQLSRYANQLVNANIALERVFSLEPRDDQVLSFNDIPIHKIQLSDIIIKHGERSIPIENFLITAGTLTVVLGNSGSGKSSLLNILAGVAKPHKGTIRVNDVDATNDMLSYAHDIRYVTQEPHLLNRTILENIEYGGDGVSRQAAIHAAKLESLELTKVFLSQTQNLSGGEQKRISIARGINAPVHLYLFDEPTSGLDDTTANHIAKSLKALSDTSIVVIATHDRRFLDVATNVLHI